MRSHLITLAIVIFSAAAAFGQGRGLDGTQWTLTQANGRDVTGAVAYFEIDAGGRRFTGSTGCNNMFGTVQVRGQSIKFSAIGTTKRMCKLVEGSVPEDEFLRAMGKAARFSRSGTNLNIMDQRGRMILRFRMPGKLPPVVDTPTQSGLEDRKWMLESIGRRRTTAPIKGVFVNFDAVKRSAGGNGGCNVFGGEYSATGSKIAIKNVVSTMRACMESGKMTTEREFLDGLRAANRFEIKENRLFLYRDRELLLTLRGEPKN